MNDEILELNVKLIEIGARNTIDYISSKIKNAKADSDKEKIVQIQSEIINDLINDKQELTMIASTYKEKIDGIIITDDDITHLHNTINSILPILASFTNDKNNMDDFKPLVELLNKDTLKTMQLLGFNYKKAIGEPLTEVCSSAITNKLSTQKRNKKI